MVKSLFILLAHKFNTFFIIIKLIKKEGSILSLLSELKHFTNNLTLLIVEDEMALNSELESMMSLLFKDVFVAFDGVDGLDKYKKHRADIILTDISMPKMNGIKMSQEIKNIKRDQHIVVLSAHGDTNFMIDLIDVGIDQFILKPLDRNTLMYKLLKVAENIVYKKEFDKFYKEKEKERLSKTIKIDQNQSKETELNDTITAEKITVTEELPKEEYNYSHVREDASDFMESIENDDIIWQAFKDDVDELMQLSSDFSDYMDVFNLTGIMTSDIKDNVVQILHSFVHIFATLDQMVKMTEVLESFAGFLDQLDIDTLTQEQHKQLKMLEFINNDISRFLQTVFVYRDKVDIYYLEDSLESSIEQLKNEILGVEIEDEDDMEFLGGVDEEDIDC